MPNPNPKGNGKPATKPKKQVDEAYVKDKDGLNAQQRRFCEEYLTCLTQKDAALRAGYSPDTANVIGYNLLKNPNVKKYIDKLLVEKKSELGITLGEVLSEMKKIAFSSDEKTYIRLQALNSLAKYLKMWDDKPQVVIQNPVESMTDAQLKEFIKKNGVE